MLVFLERFAYGLFPDQLLPTGFLLGQVSIGGIPETQNNFLWEESSWNLIVKNLTR